MCHKNWTLQLQYFSRWPLEVLHQKKHGGKKPFFSFCMRRCVSAPSDWSVNEVLLDCSNWLIFLLKSKTFLAWISNYIGMYGSPSWTLGASLVLMVLCDPDRMWRRCLCLTDSSAYWLCLQSAARGRDPRLCSTSNCFAATSQTVR